MIFVILTLTLAVWHEHFALESFFYVYQFLSFVFAILLFVQVETTAAVAAATSDSGANLMRVVEVLLTWFIFGEYSAAFELFLVATPSLTGLAMGDFDFLIHIP